MKRTKLIIAHMKDNITVLLGWVAEGGVLPSRHVIYSQAFISHHNVITTPYKKVISIEI